MSTGMPESAKSPVAYQNHPKRLATNVGTRVESDLTATISGRIAAPPGCPRVRSFV